MNAFELAVKEALAAEGETKLANRAYLELIKANFMVPIEKREDDAVHVLYITEKDSAWLPVFSSEVYFDAWAKDVKEEIQILRLSGVDLLKGVGENVTVAMNIGSDIYKAFLPAELARMRSMVLKLF
ncbi:MAG: SseB family protein [Gammaproteobacteria bacterium]|nr:SseB family protein [Gammaproteobacteria bacterium]